MILNRYFNSIKREDIILFYAEYISKNYKTRQVLQQRTSCF